MDDAILMVIRHEEDEITFYDYFLDKEVLP